METHSLIQGSAEWHAHRAKYRNASHAPAMMNVSPYQTRTELLHELHSGFAVEVDAGTQKRFDDGHRYEALARSLAEEIVEEDLYPVTVSTGLYSASMDGLNMAETISFEHKTLNDAIRAAKTAEDLPEYLRIQMEHQFIASPGTARCLFMASKWDNEDVLLEKKNFWYEPDLDLRARIIAGWDQFERDLANYVPVVHAEKPQANAIMQLPALSVMIRGEVLASNLPAFTSAAEHFLANIKTDLQTDADFADAEETVKFCDRAEKELELAKKAAIAQTTSIDELMRTIDYVKEELRSKRLMLDKLVKTQKEVIKNQIVADGRFKFSAHVAALEVEIYPIRLVYQQPDFQGAIKNKRTLASLHDAVNSTLANAKIATDKIAQDVRAQIAWYKDQSVGFDALFPDLDRIVYKAADDFQMLVKSRIDQHKIDLAKKLEAERARIQAEAQEAAIQKTPLAAAQPQIATEVVKPTLVKAEPQRSAVSPALMALARRDLAVFRKKYQEISELAAVMQEIDFFLEEYQPITKEQQNVITQ